MDDQPIDYSAIKDFSELRRNDRYDKALAGRHFELFKRAVLAIGQVIKRQAYRDEGYTSRRKYFKEKYGIHSYVLSLYSASSVVFEVKDQFQAWGY